MAGSDRFRKQATLEKRGIASAGKSGGIIYFTEVRQGDSRRTEDEAGAERTEAPVEQDATQEANLTGVEKANETEDHS